MISNNDNIDRPRRQNHHTSMKTDNFTDWKTLVQVYLRCTAFAYKAVPYITYWSYKIVLSFFVKRRYLKFLSPIRITICIITSAV